MAEPITRDDAKRQLSIVGTAEDTLIDDAIVDARGWIEDYTGLILTRRVVTEALPKFTSKLSAWPIISIDSVGYVDAGQSETTLGSSSYLQFIGRRPASMSARSWPSIYPGSAVSVTMIAGFATPEDIAAFSPNIMRAMRVLVAGFYMDREGGEVFAKAEASAKRLCRSFRRWSV